VFENRELKAKVTQEAERLLAPGGFFASNTSTLPITGLAKASARPEKFVGIHFFSPVDKMKLVEIIRGKSTDDETVARAYDYVQAIGKIPIVVNDCARLLHQPRVRHLRDGRRGDGRRRHSRAGGGTGRHPGRHAGRAAGGAGRDGAVAVGARAGPDPRRLPRRGRTYIATPGELLVERMVKEFDRNGRAAGAGFYEYPQEKGAKKFLWPELKTLFEQPGVAWDLQDLKDRLLYRQSGRDRRAAGRGRADQRARRQHRFDLRHRLPGLDRWRGDARSSTAWAAPRSSHGPANSREDGPGFAVRAGSRTGESAGSFEAALVSTRPRRRGRNWWSRRGRRPGYMPAAPPRP
jgi:3-hydroxyacyl-CoA dehydrogenase/enoyl-CoA hydratase/3-hydroxybutyryl-CoA epimerase